MLLYSVCVSICLCVYSGITFEEVDIETSSWYGGTSCIYLGPRLSVLILLPEHQFYMALLV